jgi:DNA-binding transcriptional regulator YiaG
MNDIDGAEVRRLRMRLGLTQAELARKLGVCLSLVGKWERGYAMIPNVPQRLLLTLLDDIESGPET